MAVKAQTKVFHLKSRDKCSNKNEIKELKRKKKINDKRKPLIEELLLTQLAQTKRLKCSTKNERRHFFKFANLSIVAYILSITMINKLNKKLK